MNNLESGIFKEMTEHSDEVFFIFNPNEMRFVYVNAAFENITRRSLNELYNAPLSLFKIIHKDDRKNIKENFRYVLNSKTKSLLDFRILRSDNTERWIRLKIYPIIDQDKIQYLSGIVEDDSVRQQNIQNMQKVNGWKDSTLEILAHDLRGPIGIVKLLSSAIASKLPEAENKQIHQWTKMIGSISKQNIDLIQNLIKKESLDTAGVRMSKKRVDVVSEINEVMQVYIHSQKKMSKKLHFTYSHEKIYAEVDNMKFLQIINNLVSNAIKFTGEDGNITVHVEDLEKTFLITVLDDGIGIPKKMHPVLFNKYTKAARKGVDGQESIGLGMWIIKFFTESHGGRVWLESEENAGSKFYLEFPKT